MKPGKSHYCVSDTVNWNSCDNGGGNSKLGFVPSQQKDRQQQKIGQRMNHQFDSSLDAEFKQKSSHTFPDL